MRSTHYDQNCHFVISVTYFMQDKKTEQPRLVTKSAI